MSAFGLATISLIGGTKSIGPKKERRLRINLKRQADNLYLIVAIMVGIS